MKPDHLKSLICIGTSRGELRAMPQVVQAMRFTSRSWAAYIESQSR
jgi:hypothetical protein